MQSVSYNTFCLKKNQLMMDEPLPKSFDVIIIGTGLEESIISAAASRNGHSVLHIDSNSYYGSNWAAFNFNGIQQWIENQLKSSSDQQQFHDDDQKLQEFLNDQEELVKFQPDQSIQNIEQKWFVPDQSESQTHQQPPSKVDLFIEDQNKQQSKSESKDKESDKQSTNDDSNKNQSESKGDVSDEENPNEDTNKNQSEIKDEVTDKQNPENPDKECKKHQTDSNSEVSDDKITSNTNKSSSKLNNWSKDEVLKQSRYFNIDLVPKLFFSRGSMVELLISSNISRYTEFKNVSRVLTIMNGILEHVPSSRADVFSTKHVSVVEKRILMKFLTFCINFESQPNRYENYQDKTFVEFLKHEKLTENLIHFVVHSIAMVDDNASCIQGLESSKRFLESLGRFGNTPFLWSMYGSGELPQAFCRLSAVFGGTYYLGRSIQAAIYDKKEKKFKAIITNNLRIDCEKLVFPGKICPSRFIESKQTNGIFREVSLLSDSVLPNEKEQLSFISICPKDSGCSDSYVFAQEVGHGAAACPKKMYCFYSAWKKCGNDSSNVDILNQLLSNDDTKIWTLRFLMNCDVIEKSSNEAINGFICNDARFELDYDLSIEHSKMIFNQMYPGEEFLPRAPDPEEIIIGEEETNKDVEEDKNDSETLNKNNDEDKVENKKEDIESV